MRRRTVAIVIASLVLASPAFAQIQITTGVIQGTVTDATGAVLAGVAVEVKNIETNITESRVTDTNGRFVVLQLQPGRYTVTFRLQGFATLVQEGVVLTVGQAVNLSPQLKVSTVQETLTVTGTPVVETTRSGVASTLDERVVATLPILGRKFEDLLTLTAGVSVVQGPDGDEISFAGQRGIFNNISLDGGDYNNGFFGEQAGGQRAPIDITLDAVKEFQVIATGAPAEFGRTAGGVVNVVTKSGTNNVRGSLFHFQRLEALTGELSDGSSLQDFHREQFGGTIGGPVKRDKAFYFAALEGIIGDFTRLNIGQPVGTPCSITNPTIGANEALINDSGECQRRALLAFFQTRLGQDESLPVAHPIKTVALLLKNDVTVNANNRLALSYNFNHSRKENETFDVATYGASANGIEGDPARINVLNANWFTTLSSTRLNEFHFTYSREARPRRAVDSNLAADTGMGFAPSFRFGNPYFLQPNVDEVIWRTQIKDNVSWITGGHTIKVGGEWIHTLNDQIFRGFFTGRYLFDSVTGFLRYASPAAPGGFGPSTIGCTGGVFVTAPTACPAGLTPTGGPLLFYLQSAGRAGPATDATGASTISNEEYGLFIQDQWQVRAGLTVNYGLRWDAQIMPETVDPTTTAYALFLNDPTFPSDGTIPNQTKMWQPRAGVAWDVKRDGKSVVRANFGVFSARQNMLTQVGSVTTNGVQQQSIYVDSGLHRQFGAPTPTWPGIITPSPLPDGAFPDFSGVRVFHRDYENPRIYSVNVSYEQEVMPDVAAYVDFIWTKGTNLSRFLNYNRSDPVCCDQTGNVYRYNVAPFSPRLGEVMVATSLGRSLYRGLTLGVRKRFSNKYQLEANYVLAKDEDDDSNERDPFTDRSFNFFDLEKDYALSDRDIRHKFNFFGFFELPAAVVVNIRAQYRSPQPITAFPRVLNGDDRGRNGLRKDTEFFSLDWRLMRSFKVGTHYEIIPTVEMFNTFNNTNNINPLTTPALFDFSGFLRTGVGDPRQVQLAVKFVF
ncbi:MAG TPA: carboxypeptidase regulatory-like domain-containing protein [Vicinamibacterales bacterium]|nr:carboxypeptidase regulatory-like domain-containing protein [Vicinamibacterales bacterium]